MQTREHTLAQFVTLIFKGKDDLIIFAVSSQMSHPPGQHLFNRIKLYELINSVAASSNTGNPTFAANGGERLDSTVETVINDL
jgi:hypothetical protein